MPLQHVLRGVEITFVSNDGSKPVVLDLCHVDRRVPAC